MPKILLAATTDQRVGEILRIMDVLHNHNSTNDQSKAGEGRAQFSSPDAYDILGVDPLATAGEIKKRYWRLSLLTHPDKCSHPQASVAFAAVATAAQQLQNASSRGLVDKEREENELRQFTANYVAREERERQWKSARGEKVHTAPSAQATRTTRESWMTDVPPAFLGKSHDFGRVTTTNSRAENTKSSSIARSGQSLLEKHQANLASNKKKTSKTGNQADDWDKGAHPWRPFDRTTDLDVGNLRGRKPQEAAADFTSATAKLSSRFAPGR